MTSAGRMSPKREPTAARTSLAWLNFSVMTIWPAMRGSLEKIASTRGKRGFWGLRGKGAILWRDRISCHLLRRRREERELMLTELARRVEISIASLPLDDLFAAARLLPPNLLFASTM